MPIFPFGLNDLLVCRLLLSLSFACCYFCCSVACILLLSDGEMNVCRIIHNMSPSAFRHAGVFAKSFFNFFFSSFVVAFAVLWLCFCDLLFYFVIHFMEPTLINYVAKVLTTLFTFRQDLVCVFVCWFRV